MGAVLRSAIFLGLANLAVEGFAGANFDETICRATVSVDAEATLKEAFRKASWYAFRPADGSAISAAGVDSAGLPSHVDWLGEDGRVETHSVAELLFIVRGSCRRDCGGILHQVTVDCDRLLDLPHYVRLSLGVVEGEVTAGSESEDSGMPHILWAAGRRTSLGEVLGFASWMCCSTEEESSTAFASTDASSQTSAVTQSSSPTSQSTETTATMTASTTTLSSASTAGRELSSAETSAPAPTSSAAPDAVTSAVLLAVLAATVSIALFVLALSVPGVRRLEEASIRRRPRVGGRRERSARYRRASFATRQTSLGSVPEEF